MPDTRQQSVRDNKVSAPLRAVLSWLGLEPREPTAEPRLSRAARTDNAASQRSPSRDLRLLPAALAAWGTAALAIRLEASDAVWLGVVLTASALGCGALVGWGRRNASGLRLIMVASAVAAMVCFPAAAKLEQLASGPAAAAIKAEEQITVKLRATGDARKASAVGRDGATRWLLEATLLEGTSAGTRFTANMPVVVFAGDGWSSIVHGDLLRAAGTLAATETGDREQALLFASTTPHLLERGSGSGSPVEVVRSRFLALAAGTGAPDGGLMAGMVIGARSAVDEGLAAQMQATGLTHLTAVSGANCSYVLAFVFLAFRACRLPRWVAAVGGVVALIGFVFLVRPEPSVLRAAVMGGIGVLAVLTGRGRLSLALLFLSITALLTADPWLSVEYAFILSVTATSGLVLAGPLLARRLEAWLPAWLAQLIAVPLAAQLFCSPVLVLIQPDMPTYSLPANIVAAPVVPFITVAGMVAVMLAVPLPWAALPFAVAAGWGAAWVAAVAGFFASAPLAAIPWPGGAGGAVLTAGASLALLGLVMWWHRLGALRRRVAAAVRSARRGRPAGTLAWTAMGCVLGSVCMWVWGGAIADRLSPWTIAGCDVGQGDGFVVRTGDRSALVFDAGPDPILIDRCLDVLGIDTVDLLVLTHFHTDHYGGVEGVFADRSVSSVLYSTSEEALPDEVLRAAAAGGVVPKQVQAGDTGTLGGVSWSALWPLPEGVAASENDSSAVVMVTVGLAGGTTISALFTGDIEDASAEGLLAAHPHLSAGGIDILKVAHHGARNGGEGLIQALSPSIALISAGRQNEYGHPHAAILKALDSVGAHSVRTDVQGSFILYADEGSVQIRSLQ